MPDPRPAAANATLRALPFDHPDASPQRLPVYASPARYSRHALLQVADGPRARLWLRGLLQQGLLTCANVGRREDGQTAPASTINLGLSQRGLQALQLAPGLLATLKAKAPAFSQGAVPRAARRLGDTGDNAAYHWEPCFAPDQAHLLLSLQAADPAALAQQWARLMQLPGADALAGSPGAEHDGAHLSDSDQKIVHFGYRDGLSNPRISGLHGSSRQAHQAGELLLGYANDDAYNPWRLADQPLAAAFFRNASFGAFRKIAQHERAFRAYVSETAAALGRDRAWVMAKLCGRWPDGRLLLPDGVSEPAGAALGHKAQDFDFAHDPAGLGCPFGAHIRRMNPRSDPLAQRRLRPLMRRGMPYGPAYDGAPEAQAVARGLLGLFFCASLEDQFEHLLGEWANKTPLGLDHRGHAKDPLIGQHDDPHATLYLPAAAPAQALRLGGLAPFVSTRGTAYLLYLARPALQALADGQVGQQANGQAGLLATAPGGLAARP